MMAVFIGVTCICFAAWRMHKLIYPAFAAAIMEYEKILQDRHGVKGASPAYYDLTNRAGAANSPTQEEADKILEELPERIKKILGFQSAERGVK